MSRLDKTPYFSELPFQVKEKISDPIIDIRFYASNLKRAMKPCMIHPKPQDTVPITPLMTPLARGLI